MNREMARGGSADDAMARYGAGDDGAFGAVYDAVAPALHRYLRRRTRDAVLVEDLVQQTFLKMHLHRARFIPGAEVLPWAFAIAIRLLIDRCRGSARAQLLFVAGGENDVEGTSGDAGPEEVCGTAELAARIEREILGLPPPHRAAFELVRRDGLSLSEAAARLGTTVTGVKLRLFRACQRLRASLGEERTAETEVESERNRQ